jgi:hypothetical protein
MSSATQTPHGRETSPSLAVDQQQRTVARPERRPAESGENSPRLMWHGEALRTRDPRLILMAHSVLWLTQLSEASLGLFYTVDQRLLKFGGDVIVATTLPSAGFDLEGSLLRYRRRYHVLDPFAPLRFAASPATVLDSAELADGDALARSLYFGEYLPALGMRGQSTLLLRTDDRSSPALTCCTAPPTPISVATGSDICAVAMRCSSTPTAQPCACRQHARVRVWRRPWRSHPGRRRSRDLSRAAPATPRLRER